MRVAHSCPFDGQGLELHALILGRIQGDVIDHRCLNANALSPSKKQRQIRRNEPVEKLGVVLKVQPHRNQWRGKPRSQRIERRPQALALAAPTFRAKHD